jgi:hypothetical protein
MEIKVQIAVRSKTGESEVVEVTNLKRSAFETDTLGLSLAEARSILAGRQQSLAERHAARPEKNGGSRDAGSDKNRLSPLRCPSSAGKRGIKPNVADTLFQPPVFSGLLEIHPLKVCPLEVHPIEIRMPYPRIFVSPLVPCSYALSEALGALFRFIQSPRQCRQSIRVRAA